MSSKLEHTHSLWIFQIPLGISHDPIRGSSEGAIRSKFITFTPKQNNNSFEMKNISIPSKSAGLENGLQY